MIQIYDINTTKLKDMMKSQNIKGRILDKFQTKKFLKQILDKLSKSLDNICI